MEMLLMMIMVAVMMMIMMLMLLLMMAMCLMSFGCCSLMMEFLQDNLYEVAFHYALLC